eukprot:217628_1
MLDPHYNHRGRLAFAKHDQEVGKDDWEIAPRFYISMSLVYAIPYIFAVLLSIILSLLFSVLTNITGWTAMVSTVGIIAIILCGFIVVNVWKVREIHHNF